MTVVASILLAAVVGGVVFVLLDNWQRRTAPGAQESARGPELWTPAAAPRPAATASLFSQRTNAPAPFRPEYPLPPPGRTAESTAPLPGNQWAAPVPGYERTDPRPGDERTEPQPGDERTEPLPQHARAPLAGNARPAPPPPAPPRQGRTLWDDPPRDDDDEDRPPGLWSGWAR